MFNKYCKEEAHNKLKHLWGNSDTEIGFEAQFSPYQTVSASVAFQYGNLKVRIPNFGSQVIAGEWRKPFLIYFLSI